MDRRAVRSVKTYDKVSWHPRLQADDGDTSEASPIAHFLRWAVSVHQVVPPPPWTLQDLSTMSPDDLLAVFDGTIHSDVLTDLGQRIADIEYDNYLHWYDEHCRARGKVPTDVEVDDWLGDRARRLPSIASTAERSRMPDSGERPASPHPDDSARRCPDNASRGGFDALGPGLEAKSPTPEELHLFPDLELLLAGPDADGSRTASTTARGWDSRMLNATLRAGGIDPREAAVVTLARLGITGMMLKVPPDGAGGVARAMLAPKFWGGRITFELTQHASSDVWEGQSPTGTGFVISSGAYVVMVEGQEADARRFVQEALVRLE